MPGSREVIVSFACNDPENGDFDGRARGMSWRTNHRSKWNSEVDYVHDDFINGAEFAVDDKLLTLTIHGVAYGWKRRIPWYGNWCWEGFVMKRPVAVRLLTALNAMQEWNLNGGDSALCDWLDRSKITPEALQPA